MSFEKDCTTCGKPIRGDKDGDRWVITNKDGTPHQHPRPMGAGGGNRSFGRTEGEQHDMRRESAVKSAVEYAHAQLASGNEYTEDQVLAFARRIVQFIEQDRPRTAVVPVAVAPAPPKPAPIRIDLSDEPSPTPALCMLCGRPAAGRDKQGNLYCRTHAEAARQKASA